MARPRFNGQGFTNPTDPLAWNAESRHRVNPNISRSFMSNEHHFAENRVFNTVADDVILSTVGKGTVRTLVGAGAGEGGEVVAKKGIFGGLKGFFQRGSAGEVAEEVGEAGTVSWANRILGKGVATEAGEEGAQRGLLSRFTGAFKGKATTEGSGEIAEEATKAAARETAKDAPQALKNTMYVLNSPFAGRVMGLGAAVIVGAIGLGILGDNAEEIVDTLTGANCDERVKERGLEEGTDEYNDAVAECQEKAASTIANIGYATIGVVGLLAFLVIVPMFKGKGDDEEESDEDEGDDEE